MTLKINETTNYKMFKSKKGNREVIKNSVNRLIRSIKRNDLLSANPIIVNSKMEVIDGQHRLEACKILGLPVYYVVFDPASLTEIQLLNANQKKWTAVDFMNSYISQGNKEYMKFKDFWEEYQFPFSSTVTLLGSPNFTEGGHINARFKDGEFKVVDLERSKEIAEELKEMLNYSRPEISHSNFFFRSCFKLIRKDEGLFKKLVLAVIGHPNTIYRVESEKDYFRQFEDLINRGKTGRSIRLM